MISLKELLVTIACVVLMGAVLGAGGLAGREHAKRVVCMANLEGLGRAWVLFAQDNDDVLVGPHQDPDQWVDRPHDNPDPTLRNYTNHNSTLEEKINGIKGGLLFSYTGPAGDVSLSER